MIEIMTAFWHSVPAAAQTVLLHASKIIAVIAPLMLCVAYLTYAERKVIGYIQARLGPSRVGPRGLLQPIADGIKLTLKEIIIPTNANRLLFYLAPVLVLGPSLAAWAVIPFSSTWVIADLDAGLLYVLALTSMAVYGVIIAGWASNSKYAFLGAMRSIAQIVSYEIAMGFALVGVLIASGSLNLGAIVAAQQGSPLHWFWLPLLPLAVVYLIAGIAETNRAPFDVTEGESEIVAGIHVEYSGMAFAMFFLAEYANIILISALTALLFFGGWLSPFDGWLPPAVFDWPLIGSLLAGGLHWFVAKTIVFIFLFLWVRATFPRYRYDQIMRLGWKVFIPLTIVWLTLESIAVYYKLGPWFA